MKIKLKNADNFNKLLIREGYSKSRFSKLVGISAPMFVQISNGDRGPSPATAKRICEVLQADWDDLFVIFNPESATATTA